jgi:thioredoxin reductase (NADPH)
MYLRLAKVDRRSNMGTENHHDVVVVGGGPAGLGCALECLDINLETLLFEATSIVGGQVTEIPHSIRNVAIGRYDNGAKLVSALEGSTAILGDRVRLDQEVIAANLREGWVETRAGRFFAKAILIASGSARQLLDAAPDGAFGGDVTYQVESRPDRFSGRDVVVIGGGDSASLDALELAETASSVMLVHRSKELTARGDIVERLRHDSRIEELAGWEIESTNGSDRLEEVVLVRPATAERRVVAAGGLVVKISRVPRTSAFRGQIDLDNRGAVVVDGLLRTSCPGVFAAGDVVAGAYWRIAAALGQGVLAARSILAHVDASS